jgi:hypothetical protein
MCHVSMMRLQENNPTDKLHSVSQAGALTQKLPPQLLASFCLYRPLCLMAIAAAAAAAGVRYDWAVCAGRGLLLLLLLCQCCMHMLQKSRL